MDLVNFLASISPASFDDKRLVLMAPPYNLEVREEGNLYTVMFSDTSPDSHSVPFMKNCVGIILEKETDKVVAYTFDRTKELSVDPHMQTSIAAALDVLSAEDAASCHIAPYVEGVKITLFHHNGKWSLATSRMIDAYKAYWAGNKSFGLHFQDVCRVLYPDLWKEIEGGPAVKLDCGMCYTFILSVPEQKIVVPVSHPHIFHISTLRLGDLQTVSADLGVVAPERRAFATFDEMLASMASFSFWHPGYIIRGVANRYKVLTAQYRRAKDLLGDTPNTRRNFLQIRKDPHLQQEFLTFYPEHVGLASDVEAEVKGVASLLHRLYVKHFVSHVPRPHYDKTLFITLMQIHGDYKLTGQKRTIAKILEHFEDLPAHVQYRLLQIVPAVASFE